MKIYGHRLPDDFLIGTANSAFQSEGAHDKDGKSESIMEHFAKEYAGKPQPHQDPKRYLYGPPKFSDELGDDGCFFYEFYEEYIEDMKKTGQNTYRMSIAWPRIIPTGTGEVNQKGIDFYNKVINKLLECGIEPFVDLCHWDIPYCLYELGGYESEKFPEWYEQYVKVCFEAFGDRVKYWSTFNESQVAVGTGYVHGGFPPFIRDNKRGLLCSHHIILAHFRAVRLYKSMNLKGKIGCVNCITGVTPLERNEADMGAVERQIERYFGFFTEPMLKGTYPQVLLRECPKIKDNMPEHFQEDLDKWFMPMDFIGVNYYITRAAGYNPDTIVKATVIDSFYAAPGQMWASYPAGLLDIVQYISDEFPGVDIFITENGCSTDNHYSREDIHDPERIDYIREHLRMVSRAIRAGYPVKGYYYWNDADSYEEMWGYKFLFGLTWVDHKTKERVWKDSRYYFSEVCKTKIVG